MVTVLEVPMRVMQMIQMIIVRHRLTAVIRQVLMIKTRDMRTHCELVRVGVALTFTFLLAT